jgi:hypothetical protein
LTLRARQPARQEQDAAPSPQQERSRGDRRRREDFGRDLQGRPIYAGETGDGRRMEVVMALDDRDFVITVFGEVK